MKALNLKTAHLRNPLGIDVICPFLSWTVEEGIIQTAYQITALCGGEKVWDTGKRSGSNMHDIYEGPAESRKRIEWRVRLWDENDIPGDYSETAFFEYALLDKGDWRAEWINPEIREFDKEVNQPASVLVKEFDLEETGCVRAYVSAHGLYTVYINGKRIKENILTPGTSEYWYRLPYQTFDLSGYVKKGTNRIEVTLGDGWYRGCNGNTGTRNVFGTDIAFLMQLEVNEKVVLITDESWVAAQDGPIYYNDIQMGEKVDAGKQPNDIHEVKIEKFGYDNLLCMNTLPIREREEFSAKLIITPNGEKVLDFGQNMAGYVSFRVNARKGQKIKMTHGEYLDDAGNFSDDNICNTIGRKEKLHQVIEYTCRDGINEYEPTLCIFGFQYVKVETDLEITGEEFTAHAVYSDMEQTARFECDNPLVNGLVRNTIWSQKSNFVDIPTDCPQRERSGWTGDAGVFVDTGLILMDSWPVFARWLGECRADQYADGRIFNMSPRRQPKPSRFDAMYDGSTGWGDAVVIIPYTMYKIFGDKTILEENYEMMKGWLRYCEKKAKKTRLKNKFKKNPYKKYMIDTGIHWGEWLEAGVSTEEAMKNVILNGVPEIATAYFSYSSRMLGEIAETLGKKEDAEKYRKLSENARKAFHYIEVKDGRIRSDRQCRYVRPLYMGLLDKVDADRAAADLNELVRKNNYHLNTGFLTTPYLCKALADYGYVETAYRLLLQEDTPGWLYAVKNGATTIWESWEGNAGGTGFSSLNHYSKGAVVSWLFEGICGIHVTGQNIMIKPQVCSLLEFAKAEYDSPAGVVKSGWKITGNVIEYIIEIPSNTKAEFILEDGSVRKLKPGLNQFTVNGGIRK